MKKNEKKGREGGRKREDKGPEKRGGEMRERRISKG